LLVNSVRILWVKAGKLLPVDTGGKIRSYNILRHLVGNHELTLLSYYGGSRDSAYETELQREIRGAHTVYTRALEGGALEQSFDYLQRFFQTAPFAVTKFTHPSVRSTIVSWLREKRFDVAVCDFLSASLNFPDTLDLPTVLFQHNVETSLWQRLAATESNPAKRIAYWVEANKMSRYERRTLGRFHHVIAVSEHDRQQMLAMVPSCAISVVPTGVDTAKYRVAPPSTANPPRIVFTGSMDWEPNIDAVVYFCQDILPKIRARYPSVLFQIVGRNPFPRVKQLASDAVQVTGTVASVADYLRDATVVVVPLRIGGGTRLKIFEAMVMGKAVVSTRIGAEGLDVRDGHDLILEDDAPAFAEAIIKLLDDPGLRTRYEQAAASTAARYDWANIALHFAEVLSEVSKAAGPMGLSGNRRAAMES
jgi:polysaccharide biosynthesis protein PslH